jgi:hypothetical protein
MDMDAVWIRGIQVVGNLKKCSRPCISQTCTDLQTIKPKHAQKFDWLLQGHYKSPQI